ncbi:MAG TPA: DinB family protein [Thermoanaerobaculia bacterium]|nr:DinB family protein [Thermoanaerobaculia bacterium]
MRRPEPNEYHPAFAAYVNRVPETDILGALASQLEETRALLASFDAERAGHRYAEGKWSIREIAGHLGDGERVFGYRAFAIARGETASLPGFDENTYIAAANYDLWAMPDLIESFSALRAANLLLLRTLDEAAWSRVGTANGNPVTPRALAYVMVGHERHHINVIRERYL